MEDWAAEDYEMAIGDLETRLAYLKRRRDLLGDDRLPAAEGPEDSMSRASCRLVHATCPA